MDMRALPAVVGVILFVGCGSAAPEPRRSGPLDDDAIEAFGAAPAREPSARPEVERTTSTIALAGGETLRDLVALVRFRAGGDEAEHCALYALRAGAQGLEEGRRTVECASAGPEVAVPTAPVEDERDPVLRRALAGAALTAQTDGDVELWLTTDRRLVRGHAATPRWPSPSEEADEPFVARSPANLSELWEAVMYPARYRPE